MDVDEDIRILVRQHYETHVQRRMEWATSFLPPERLPIPKGLEALEVSISKLRLDANLLEEDEDLEGVFEADEDLTREPVGIADVLQPDEVAIRDLLENDPSIETEDVAIGPTSDSSQIEIGYEEIVIQQYTLVRTFAAVSMALV